MQPTVQPVEFWNLLLKSSEGPFWMKSPKTGALNFFAFSPRCQKHFKVGRTTFVFYDETSQKLIAVGSAPDSNPAFNRERLPNIPMEIVNTERLHKVQKAHHLVKVFYEFEERFNLASQILW